MKSYLSLFFTLFLFASCSTNDSDFDPQTEADILEYIEENNLNAQKSDSGLYYVIDNEGSGTRPSANSVVNINYKGYFLDGTVFDKNEAVLFKLDEIIKGLKEGIQLFKEEGNGILIIPSELAFGDSGNYSGSIPGGTVLVFEITVKAVYADYKEENEKSILKYIEENNLTASKTDSGLYYVINNEGTGTRPTSSSNVTVSYKGYFLNGTVFDQSGSDGASFGLNNVIAGWTEGIPYFKEGGDGILLVPYTLGYGEYGSGSIPGFTVLAFDVKLISVD